MSNSLSSEDVRHTEQSNYLSWFICLSAGMFFFYEFFQLNVFDVINQALRTSFNINAAKLSWMSSAFIWANVIFLLPAGVILDNFSARKVILLALLTCLVGTIGFGLTHSFYLAALFHALTGIGNAFCFLSCVVLVSRWFHPRKQALVIGTIVTMAFLGGMAAHTPFAYLHNSFGWRKAIMVDAAIGILILSWIYIFVRDKNTTLKKINKNKSWLSKYRDAVCNKQTWLSGIYTACLNLPIMVLCALWGGSYLSEVHNLNSISASNIVSLIFIGSIFGCPIVGFLSDKIGKRKPLMLLGAITTLLLTLPLVNSSPHSPFILSCIFLSLGFTTSTQIISYPLITESNQSCNTGIATGIASVIIMSGGGFGQVLFGYIMQHNSSGLLINNSFSNFSAAMLIFPCASVIALMTIIFMRETYCKPYQDQS
ncbi:MAG: MFS transporter [Legionellales bacterium RIFCSPHIGHO2_12_FULL_35_11]|nr:MAG: MFS transporter [Legionellales bacterium RIFCSPHIGHO2_12_FULL_35_11]